MWIKFSCLEKKNSPTCSSMPRLWICNRSESFNETQVSKYENQKMQTGWNNRVKHVIGKYEKKVAPFLCFLFQCSGLWGELSVDHNVCLSLMGFKVICALWLKLLHTCWAFFSITTSDTNTSNTTHTHTPSVTSCKWLQRTWTRPCPKALVLNLQQ